MIAVTSISPKHINAGIQEKAIKSWIDFGMKVYSINSPKEVSILEKEYPNVTFVATHRTMQLTYGRPLVSISAVIDLCKGLDDENFCIINSDIELRYNCIKAIEQEMKDSIVISNRINHDGDYRGNLYNAGFDVFFINRNYLSIFPESMHALGMTFVDYFIPFTALNSGVDLTIVDSPFAYHLNHKAQYSHDMWLKSGRFFLWENNQYQFNHTKEIGRMSTHVLNFIYNGSSRNKFYEQIEQKK